MSSSFYAPVPDAPREGLLADYQRFLAARNGAPLAEGTFEHREAWMRRSQTWGARHRGELDADAFSRLYERFEGATHPLPLVALLAFVKVNAGEAYGVDVLSRIRYRRPPTGELFDDVERTLALEERYHTRILLGATAQFGLPAPQGAWRPPLPLKLLIGTLAHVPKGWFHPVLLGAEIGGVFTFTWLLRQVGTLFREEPEVRQALEERLFEVLVDELGHIAFNRLAVGPFGVKVARQLAALSAGGTTGQTPEFKALGWTEDTTREVSRFDLKDVPEEIRRRAFFA